MGVSHTLTLSVDVAELLSEFMPRIAGAYLAAGGAGEGLAGTEFTLTVDVSGCTYSYAVKDGKGVEVREGALEKPKVRVILPLEDMQRMARLKYADFLLGMGGGISRQKADAVGRLKGTAVFKLKHDDGGITAITLVFNGAEAPRAVFSLTVEDARAVTTGHENPVQMFMAGKLRIEGDMAFAMSVQPLFS